MNIHLISRFAVAAVGAVFTCSLVDVNPAQAASFKTFNFNGFDGEYTTVPSFDFTIDDLSLNVTATSEDGLGQVRRTVGGLGVFDGLGRGREIDAAGGLLETLFLNFGKKVSLVSATFGYVDGDDAFNLSVGDNSLFNGEDIPDSNIFDFTSLDLTQTTAKTFSFTANAGSSYSLQSITVAAVPEPTTIFGLMAVGALASVGLKRKS
ncbi:PEP-CTERM sorting domain-containing protein [Capilliphycus salinus ALCB114379]|uniref:PEP-CTERM sorting domain-containing protein n=1 Tax=Capilliphycus salinus TaxID=2768948 RepID=UPI0039A73BD9